MKHRRFFGVFYTITLRYSVETDVFLPIYSWYYSCPDRSGTDAQKPLGCANAAHTNKRSRACRKTVSQKTGGKKECCNACYYLP